MQIVTERLLMREFRAEDWTAVWRYQNDSRYLRYYEWTGRTPEEAQAFVQMFINQQQAQPRLKYQLAVTMKETGKLIGNCGIRRTAVTATEADIGYELSPEHWGHGYATEAATAILKFGFTELQLHRIWAECVADNVGSAHVLTKIGMTQEGHLREKSYYKDRWWDTLLFAILADKWRAQTT
jgi:RimJ/RimL family protein N-acetyltransferase